MTQIIDVSAMDFDTMAYDKRKVCAAILYFQLAISFGILTINELITLIEKDDLLDKILMDESDTGAFIAQFISSVMGFELVDIVDAMRFIAPFFA